MKNILHLALFLLPILALIAAVAFIQHKMNDDNKTNTAAELTLKDKKNSNITPYNLHHSKQVNPNFHNYNMPEPFATQLPGEGVAAMQNAMNPYLWMQLMTHSMNQMMTMMNMNNWVNPHSFIPNQTSAAVQPMDPKEYERLYNQYIKELEAQKK